MTRLKTFGFTAIVVCLFFASVKAQQNDRKMRKTSDEKKSFQPLAFRNSFEIDKLLRDSVEETLKVDVPKIKEGDKFAATLIDLREPENLRMGNYNGDVQIYPASVVKLFYLVATHRWLEDGKLQMTPELERGLRDMIVDSSNDATHYILDVLTDTSGGGELSPKELEKYAEKRNSVNRYFRSMGYENINVNQKTYCEDLYGRERQFWNGGKNRNMLTTDATARLMAEIALGKAVSPERSRQMLELLKRDPFVETSDEDNQAHGFTGIALRNLNLKDAKLWSKAGWTSKSRHDVAYVETPDGLKFVLAVFTENNADNRKIIPDIAEKVIKGLREIK